jgi:hypothetical protein
MSHFPLSLLRGSKTKGVSDYTGATVPLLFVDACYGHQQKGLTSHLKEVTGATFVFEVALLVRNKRG